MNLWHQATGKKKKTAEKKNTTSNNNRNQRCEKKKMWRTTTTKKRNYSQGGVKRKDFFLKKRNREMSVCEQENETRKRTVITTSIFFCRFFWNLNTAKARTGTGRRDTEKKEQRKKNGWMIRMDEKRTHVIWLFFLKKKKTHAFLPNELARCKGLFSIDICKTQKKKKYMRNFRRNDLEKSINSPFALIG